MKKVSLFLLAVLFSVGVMAQTSPTSSQKPATNAKVQPTSAPAQPKAATTSTGAENKNIKKTGTNKKTSHHVTPVHKSGTTAESKGKPAENSKK